MNSPGLTVSRRTSPPIVPVSLFRPEPVASFF